MEDSVLALLSFLAISCVGGAGLLRLHDTFSRPVEIEDPPLRQFPRRPQAEPAPAGVSRFDSWLERTLYLSGWSLSPLEASLLSILVALALGGMVLLASENLLAASIAGLAGLTFPLVGIILAQRKRVRRFAEQFPDALFLIARAVRAGESLDQAIELVGQTAHDPLAVEFRRCAGQMNMGLSVPAAMQGLQQRMDLMDVRIFANTIAMHRDLGGNLPATLERLAQVIRERYAYQRQLKSVTGAGRFSAMFIGLLGASLFAYLILFQPEYAQRLLESGTGQAMLCYAAVSQLAGLFWVSRIVRREL